VRALITLGGLFAAALLAFAPPEMSVQVLFVLSGGRATLDRFDHPAGVAVDEANREVYVADSGNARILVFGFSGELRAELRLVEGPRMPTGIALGPGVIYVTGDDLGPVAVLDARGRLKDRLDVDPKDAKPVQIGKIALAADRLYMVDRANDRLLAFNVSTRRSLFAFGGHGTDEGRFETLAGMAVGPQGDLYAVDMRRASVTVFDRSGAFLKKFGEAGSSFGQMGMPMDVAVDGKGRVFVVDATRHTLLIYDSDTRPLREFGGLGRSPGWFYYPRGAYADAAGRLYVVEPFLNRVQVFGISP
jgi:DNA-binding beta-propeller fold protein YncE